MDVRPVLRSPLVIALALALAFTSKYSDAQSTAVGHTAGEGYVSSTGEAGYRIPLQFPSGILGVEPSLALTYGHHGGDGLLGVGWSLEGLSVIRRCGRTLAQDGALSPVDLSATDRLCLDGQRLRGTAGTYGLSGSTYQTELETFSRVTANGAGGSAPTWFKVEGRDGLIYHYGNSADSRIESTGTSAVREWALNRVEDRAGNYLTVTYAKDATNGTYRPTEIRYTGTSGAAPAYGVHFQYEDRPTGDRPSGYFAGGAIVETKRLVRIEARYGSTVVRRYNLSYGPTGASERSRLESVEECGLNAAACLPATQFSWMPFTAGWDIERLGIAVPNLEFALPGDFDGDGFEDLAYFDPGANAWMILSGTSFGYQPPAVNIGMGHLDQYHRALVGDLDGSGRPGILVPDSSNTWSWIRHLGSGFAASSTGVSNAGQMVLADVDGDGRPDLVFVGPLKVRWQRNVTTGLIPSFAASADLWSFPMFQYTGASPLGANREKFRSVIRAGDFNGDGRTDLLLYSHHDICSGEPGCGPNWG